MEYLCLLILLVAVVIRVIWMIYRTHPPGNKSLVVDGVVYVCRIHSGRDNLGEEYAEPALRCLYKVNGVTYTLALADTYSWTCRQQEWVNVGRFYPSSFEVLVYYDPNQPERALVKPKVT